MKFTSTIKSVIPADIRVVWQVVTSLENYAWRSDISRIEKEDEESFTEYITSGIATRFIVTSFESCNRYEFDLENENLKGHWTGVFRKTVYGTEIIFTETVSVKKWWMIPWVKLFLKKQQACYVADLKRRCQCS